MDQEYQSYIEFWDSTLPNQKLFLIWTFEIDLRSKFWIISFSPFNNPFQTKLPFQYPLDISENQRFSNDFWRCGKGTLVWNRLSQKIWKRKKTNTFPAFNNRYLVGIRICIKILIKCSQHVKCWKILENLYLQNVFYFYVVFNIFDWSSKLN